VILTDLKTGRATLRAYSSWATRGSKKSSNGALRLSCVSRGGGRGGGERRKNKRRRRKREISQNEAKLGERDRRGKHGPARLNLSKAFTSSDRRKGVKKFE